MCVLCQHFADQHMFNLVICKALFSSIADIESPDQMYCLFREIRSCLGAGDGVVLVMERSNAVLEMARLGLQQRGNFHCSQTVSTTETSHGFSYFTATYSTSSSLPPRPQSRATSQAHTSPPSPFPSPSPSPSPGNRSRRTAEELEDPTKTNVVPTHFQRQKRSLSEAEQRREDSMLCRLCFERRRSVILLKCGHSHFCKEVWNEVIQ